MNEIILPWPSADLSPNSRVHWSRRSKAAKAGAAAGYAAAIAAGWNRICLPTGRLNLWIDFYPPTRRLPDDDNMLARCKAYRDGIALALGIDDKRFVSHPMVRETPRKGGQVVFDISSEEKPLDPLTWTLR